MYPTQKYYTEVLSMDIEKKDVKVEVKAEPAKAPAVAAKPAAKQRRLLRSPLLRRLLLQRSCC